MIKQSLQLDSEHRRSKTFVAASFIWLGPQLKGHGRFKSKLFQAQVEKCAREFEGSEDAQGPGLQLPSITEFFFANVVRICGVSGGWSLREEEALKPFAGKRDK